MTSPEDFIENWVETLSQPDRKYLLSLGMPACTPVDPLRAQGKRAVIFQEQHLLLPHADFVLSVGLYRVFAPQDKLGPSETYWIVTMHPLRRA